MRNSEAKGIRRTTVTILCVVASALHALVSTTDHQARWAICLAMRDTSSVLHGSFKLHKGEPESQRQKNIQVRVGRLCLRLLNDTVVLRYSEVIGGEGDSGAPSSSGCAYERPSRPRFCRARLAICLAARHSGGDKREGEGTRGVAGPESTRLRISITKR